MKNNLAMTAIADFTEAEQLGASCFPLHHSWSWTLAEQLFL